MAELGLEAVFPGSPAGALPQRRQSPAASGPEDSLGLPCWGLLGTR